MKWFVQILVLTCLAAFAVSAGADGCSLHPAMARFRE
jgi:hypothetical protein